MASMGRPSEDDLGTQQSTGETTLGTVFLHQLVVGLQSEPGYRQPELETMPGELRVVGVENQTIGGLMNDELGSCQVVEIVDSRLGKVIFGDVGHQGDVGPPHGQTATQHATTGGLEYGDLDTRMPQHLASASRARVIPFLDHLIADADPIRRAGTSYLVGRGHNRGQQPNGRAFAVGTRDQGHRDVVHVLPVDLVRRRDFTRGPGNGTCSQTDRNLVIVRQRRDAVLGGGGHHFYKWGIAFGIDLGTQTDTGRGQVARLGAFEPGTGGVKRPLVDLGGGIERIDGGGKGKGKPPWVGAMGELGIRPPHLCEDSPRLQLPGLDQTLRVLAFELDIDHRSRAREKQVRSGKTTRVSKLHDSWAQDQEFSRLLRVRSTPHARR
jgi:hypothetical protein